MSDLLLNRKLSQVESSDLRARELPEAPVSSDIYCRFKKRV